MRSSGTVFLNSTNGDRCGRVGPLDDFVRATGGRIELRMNRSVDVRAIINGETQRIGEEYIISCAHAEIRSNVFVVI